MRPHQKKILNEEMFHLIVEMFLYRFTLAHKQDTNNENLEKLLKQHSTMFDLCGPMRGCPTPHERHLFMEGDLRLKDSTTKVIDYSHTVSVYTNTLFSASLVPHLIRIF